NKDAVLQPNELALLWGYGDTERSHWINAEDQFTPHLEEAYKIMLQPDAAASSPAEEQRHKVVLDELAQGRPTLVETDLSQETPDTANAIRYLLNAARFIEFSYAMQKGVFGLEGKIPGADSASRMLLYRNQSSFREGPRT